MSSPTLPAAPLSRDQDATARLVQRLGHAGLAPFVLLALLIWLVDASLHPFVALALAAWGAAIVSFLGGVHWGIALRDAGASAARFHLAWGAVPALLAWLAIVMPAYAGLPLLGLILVVCYLADRRSWPAAGLAEWLPLRLRLTAVATLSCLLGAAGT
ncbi:DUF3429 domain-containing protein [Ramlibacter sp. 2FC]|uniref:DUF3429 domain-containing protein n=1 Tax=Ramlibacter sp. 2FC TaxID=2502188 RepID=UPI0010F9F54A|nr:DUF3429 domain-containing protein [Ramlibacter sp. 2FC]